MLSLTPSLRFPTSIFLALLILNHFHSAQHLKTVKLYCQLFEILKILELSEVFFWWFRLSFVHTGKYWTGPCPPEGSCQRWGALWSLAGEKGAGGDQRDDCDGNNEECDEDQIMKKYNCKDAGDGSVSGSWRESGWKNLRLPWPRQDWPRHSSQATNKQKSQQRNKYSVSAAFSCFAAQ